MIFDCHSGIIARESDNQYLRCELVMQLLEALQASYQTNTM